MHGQALETRVNVLSQVVDDVLLQVVVDPNSQAVEEFTEEKGADEQSDRRCEHPNLILRNHVIDHELGELRIGEGEAQGEQGAANGGKGHPLVGRQINPDAPDHLPGCAGLGLKCGICVRAESGM